MDHIHIKVSTEYFVKLIDNYYTTYKADWI